jgi:hypothetical protein
VIGKEAWEMKIIALVPALLAAAVRATRKEEIMATTESSEHLTRRSIAFNRLPLAVIVAAAAALSLMQVAQAGPPPPVVPDAIKVPDGNKVFLVGHGVGVQIYSCNGVVWSFVAPRANL